MFNGTVLKYAWPKISTAIILKTTKNAMNHHAYEPVSAVVN